VADSGTDKSVLLSLDRDVWHKIKLAAVDGWAYAYRMSVGFLIRFLLMNEVIGEKYHILKEVDFLEGLHSRSNTKERQFKRGSRLYPLWHKHWFAPRHLIRNVGARWGLDRNGNHQDLDRMIDGIASAYGNDPDQWPGMLAYMFWIRGFEDRSKRHREF
jgi:hypothetical protein